MGAGFLGDGVGGAQPAGGLFVAAFGGGYPGEEFEAQGDSWAVVESSFQGEAA
ncbi:hypothetical protein D3C83_332870 [compost metagenome]